MVPNPHTPPPPKSPVEHPKGCAAQCPGAGVRPGVLSVRAGKRAAGAPGLRLDPERVSRAGLKQFGGALGWDWVTQDPE